MTMKQFAEKLITLFDVILKISTDDYRIVLSVRDGGTVDVYIRNDKKSGSYTWNNEVIIALQTVELFTPDDIRVEYHWCLSSHEQFKDKEKEDEGN